MKHLTYLAIDLACLLVPLLFSFHPKRTFYKEWRYFLPANLIVAICFLVWDALFTRWGVWGFHPDYLCGIYLFNLPLEEVLFFICIPYACVFSWFVLPYLLPRDPLRGQRKAFILLAILSAGVCLCFWDRIYTSLTLLLLLLYLIGRGVWGDLGRRYDLLSYLCIIPFFLISNGILTGTGLDQPIVWYSEAAIIGLRLGSIPIEDTAYGLLLVLLNIELYSFFRKRARPASQSGRSRR